MRILQQLIGAYLVSCLATATLMMAASLGLSPGGDNSLLLITSGAFFCGALCCALCGDTNRRGHNLRGALRQHRSSLELEPLSHWCAPSR